MSEITNYLSDLKIERLKPSLDRVSQHWLTLPHSCLGCGTTYARFRLGSTQTEVESSVGEAASGEVEDYKLPIVGNPNILLVKRITAINGGTITVGVDSLSDYKNDPTNAYDDNELNIPTQTAPTDPPKDTDKWPDTVGATSSTFLRGGMNGGFVRPNDILEYTIYFLSAGDMEARNLILCDRVPDNITFMPNVFNTSITADSSGVVGAERGIAVYLGGVTNDITKVKSYTNISDGDFAVYYPPGSDAKTDFPTIECGGANTNGAVVVNLGNLPNANNTGIPIVPNSYGFIRFQGRENDLV